MTSEATGDRLHRIGEISRKIGLTVRALHHYEAIGLIEPHSRTEAGHRLYGAAAIERLYRISVLRDLGLGLDDVAAGLDGGDLRSLMSEHLGAVEARLAAEQRLRNRLARLVGILDDAASATEDTAGDLLNVLEDMTMLETRLDRRIAVLVYDDIEAAYQYLVDTFGFGPGELTRDPDGTVVHGEIEAGDGEFWLHQRSEEFGLKTPAELGGATGSMVVLVDDVDAHHRYAVEHGAAIRYEPTDMPYGYREYGAVDLAGHLWSFMRPLE